MNENKAEQAEPSKSEASPNKISGRRPKESIQNVRAVLITANGVNLWHLLAPGDCNTYPPAAVHVPKGWRVGRCDFGEDDEEALIVGWEGKPVLEGLFRLWRMWTAGSKPAPFPLVWDGGKPDHSLALAPTAYWAQGVCAELNYRVIFLNEDGVEIEIEDDEES